MTTLRLFTDGAARGNPGPAGLGLVIEDTEGMRLWGGCRYIGTATNNQAEYLALIEGLRKAAEWRPDRIEVYMYWDRVSYSCVLESVEVCTIDGPYRGAYESNSGSNFSISVQP